MTNVEHSQESGARRDKGQINNTKKARGSVMSNLGSIVRIGLLAIPRVGEVLATIWSEWDTSRRFTRVEETLSDFVRRIKRLEHVFDPNSIGEEECQLLEEVLRRVQIEHREQKRQRYSALLASAWKQAGQMSFESRMQFVRALEDFDEVHIKVLSFLHGLEEPRDVYPKPSEIGESLGMGEDERRYVLMPALDVLAGRYRFIERNWSLGGEDGHILWSKNLSAEGLGNKCGHKITEIGQQFLEFISDDCKDEKG